MADGQPTTIYEVCETALNPEPPPDGVPDGFRMNYNTDYVSNPALKARQRVRDNTIDTPILSWKQAYDDTMEAADTVAARHFPELHCSPYVDAGGREIPITDTENKRDRKYKPYTDGLNPKKRQRMRDQELYRAPIRQLKDMFAGNITEVGAALLDLALGVKVLRTTPQGMVEVYDTPPDPKAIDMILNRIMGKATEHKEVEHSGETRNVHIVIPHNDRPLDAKVRVSVPDKTLEEKRTELEATFATEAEYEAEFMPEDRSDGN